MKPKDIDTLRQRLQVYKLPDEQWHWETGDYCSEDGHPTPEAAEADFEAQIAFLVMERQSNIDLLRQQLQIYEIPGYGWSWEAGDYCAESVLPSPAAAEADFEDQIMALMQ
ncbi:hypothetical protein [Nodosilinea sp. P-1105]|uniref:hypothetical protein n=1 Tax=Nodosilinea sp. P-1105 TaxID=2546229 RepID=UPI00146F19E8|nr:hypothetical protein [Nodosilinea sp. P-1105]NMF84678.1 hypothetical protein [Nodosilinea sp. P-1105]